MVLRRSIVVAGGALLMAGTIVGFILARTVGIFGFKLTFSSGEADAVLIIEAAAVVVLLLLAAWTLRRTGRRPDSRAWTGFAWASPDRLLGERHQIFRTHRPRLRCHRI